MGGQGFAMDNRTERAQDAFLKPPRLRPEFTIPACCFPHFLVFDADKLNLAVYRRTIAFGYNLYPSEIKLREETSIC